jgi:hypothetical protein
MINKALSKKMKKVLREYAEQAYCKEMSIALDALYESMNLWKQGQVTVYQMNDEIHNYHNGASREVYNRYNTTHLNLAVASAIQRGILEKEAIDPEFLEVISAELTIIHDQ